MVLEDIKVGTNLFGYEVVDFKKDEHPIFGDLYVLRNEEETIQLHELELLNNIELWEKRHGGK